MNADLMRQLDVLFSRIEALERENLSLRDGVKKALALHDDFPDDRRGGDAVGEWPGKVYVLGITYSGLTNAAMPYVRVTLGAGGSVLVEETDEAFPSEMPPNEEWYIKAEETVPPRITRFG